jgi:hypothetical protein
MTAGGNARPAGRSRMLALWNPMLDAPGSLPAGG